MTFYFNIPVMIGIGCLTLLATVRTCQHYEWYLSWKYGFEAELATIFLPITVPLAIYIIPQWVPTFSGLVWVCILGVLSTAGILIWSPEKKIFNTLKERIIKNKNIQQKELAQLKELSDMIVDELVARQPYMQAALKEVEQIAPTEKNS